MYLAEYAMGEERREDLAKPKDRRTSIAFLVFAIGMICATVTLNSIDPHFASVFAEGVIGP